MVNCDAWLTLTKITIMPKGVYNVPFPINEPVKSYAPGSPEKEELLKLLPGMSVILVDGEMFSWYGSRLLLADTYLNNLYFNLLKEVNRLICITNKIHVHSVMRHSWGVK